MDNIANRRRIALALFFALLAASGACAQTASKPDTSSHQVQFLTVDKDVRLEVLDWGGSGPPLIFLAGLGDTAHVFDSFAPRFTAGHHVYGITRRGFGKSSAPPPTEENYAADRLGDDVLAIIDALKLDRPVLAGHSIAGEELSSVGSRYPEKIAGLIYLEAGLAYAYYDPAHWEGGLIVDANELRRKLDLLMLNQTMVGAIRDIPQGNLISQLDKDLQVMQKQFQGVPTPPSGTPAQPLSPAIQVSVAISKGERKYTSLKCPVLDLIAWPSDPGPPIRAQASAFEGIPSAHVVRVLNADHYIFRSNDAEVEREMNAFMDRLNPTKPRAAKAFDAWLLALNASDRSRMEKVLEEFHMGGTAESLMNFARRTGGLNLLRVEQSTEDRLTAVVGERNSDTIARGTLALTTGASGQVVKGEMDFRVIPREGELAIPRLRQAEALKAMEDRISALAADDRFSGAYLIAQDGKILTAKAYGWSNRETSIPATIETKFRMGSMNKMFTAVGALQLVAAGKLSLDGTVRTYLTEYPNKEIAVKVTIRELLDHTGGTGDFFGPEFEARRLSLKTHADYVALFGTRPPLFEPGSKDAYSNYGFLLLGRIIEKVSGLSYYDYVAQHIFARAGMTSTGSLPEDQSVPGRSVPYTSRMGKWVSAADTLPYRGTAAGGGYTTVGDLLKFSQALENGKLLPSRLMGDATTPHNHAGDYGYGFGIAGQGLLRRYGHNGGAPGMNGDLTVYPALKRVVAVLSNYDPPAAENATKFYQLRMPATPLPE